ncbi:hypothetical protein EK904_004697, partial [Melospiza melodia maxima]
MSRNLSVIEAGLTEVFVLKKNEPLCLTLSANSSTGKCTEQAFPTSSLQSHEEQPHGHSAHVPRNGKRQGQHPSTKGHAVLLIKCQIHTTNDSQIPYSAKFLLSFVSLFQQMERDEHCLRSQCSLKHQ